jgi:muconolactone delta-isomerase
MEYLVTMTAHVLEETPEPAVEDIRTREAARARELAAQGHLLRLCALPCSQASGAARTLRRRRRRPARGSPRLDAAAGVAH